MTRLPSHSVGVASSCQHTGVSEDFWGIQVMRSWPELQSMARILVKVSSSWYRSPWPMQTGVGVRSDYGETLLMNKASHLALWIFDQTTPLLPERVELVQEIIVSFRQAENGFLFFQVVGLLPLCGLFSLGVQLFDPLFSLFLNLVFSIFALQILQTFSVFV